MQPDPTLTKAEIFTQGHRYSGMVMTRGYRLAELLNDVSTRVVEIRDVRVSQPTRGQLEPIECPHLLVRKDAILLAYPSGGHEAPARRLYSFVEKQRYQAQVVMPGHFLVGTVHLPFRASPMVLMSEQGTEPSFVPLTDVTVHFAAADAQALHTKVVLFRRQFIESLFLSETPMPAPSLLDTVRESDDVERLALAKLSTDVRPPTPESPGSAFRPDESRDAAPATSG